MENKVGRGTVIKLQQGRLDFKMYPDRIFIKNLDMNATSASLFVRVDAVAPNIPLEEENGVLTDRFVVQVSDESGVLLFQSFRLLDYIHKPFRVAMHYILG
jgi:hypothetical protein